MKVLKEKIIMESQKLGIDKIGFASAKPFTELEEPLREQKRKGHTSGFEHPIIEERINVQKTFPEAKTIIAIALAYPTKSKEPMPRDEKRGQFARVSWGIDYHDILQERMQKLIKFIQKEAQKRGQEENWHFAPQVDTGELVDVAVAQRAGLGFVGRNGLLITQEYGSFVYLGEIVTNIDFPTDKPVEFGCGDCTRCITNCPTQALLGDGSMNAQRCLAYQTQTKGMMPEEYRKKIRNTIYGCDICQLVCPYNKGKDFHLHQEMESDVDMIYPKLKPLLTITNKEFQSQFGHVSGAWRGKKPLQRNAIIALANLGDKQALPEIYECTKDPRPVIRGTAIWAISQLGKKDGKKWSQILKELAKDENETEVLLEIERALIMLNTQKK